VKICVTPDHDIKRIRGIVYRQDSDIVVLESDAPSMNNRVIRYAQLFTKEGWKKVNTKLITICRRRKKGTAELHVISVMLKRCQCGGRS